jgi:hypothetical protein
VASLQEQAGADVVLKTLGTGLHPRRSKSLATLLFPCHSGMLFPRCAHAHRKCDRR